MTIAAAALLSAGMAAGVLLFVAGIHLVPVPPDRSGSPLRGTTLTHSLSKLRLSRRDQILALTALAFGVVIALLSGWAVAIVVLPAAAIGLPKLLMADPRIARSLERLEGMQDWTRSLASVMSVGQSLEQAVRSTLRSTPASIQPHVAALVARLNARWDTSRALRVFADELDDPTGDLIAAALIVGSKTREEARLASVLTALAESVQQEVTARRAIEADRDRHRGSIRIITAISATVLLAASLTGQFSAYGTPLGQLLLTILLVLYVGCLWWMRRMTRPVILPRFMGTAVRESR